jgi:hypothetical protein
MASIILADRQYTLNTFYEVLKSNQFGELSDEIITIINNLSEKVGAPSYKKTPIFKQNYREHNGKRGRPRQKQHVITTEDWEAIRNFKSTKLEKAVNPIDKEIENITSLLNKLTDSNYSIISGTIKELLEKIISSEIEIVDLEKIGHAIFEVGSINKYWARLYAKLYKDLIKSFPIMHTISINNFSKFMSVFDDIRFVSADEDYDLFCKVKKENNRRRSLSSFFVHLMNNDIIESSQIINIIENLMGRFMNLIDKEHSKDVVLEIGENIIILIEQGMDKLSDDEDNSWEDITTFVEKVSCMKQKEHTSLSSQVIFKFLDLNDEL